MKKEEDRRVMRPSVSVYLDAVRFAAAFVVFLSHAEFSNFSSGWLSVFADYGPQAVMVFFVLSGFVIAYVTDTRKPTPRRYVTDRAARIYSVVLPAILVTLLADKVGMRFNAQTYYCCYDYSESFLDIITSVFLLNEVWFNHQALFSNGPFWSISYEVAYYVLYALLVFTPGRWKIPAVMLASLLIGPVILLLAPVWFAGVGAYYVSKRHAGSLILGLSLFTGSILAFIAADLAGMPQGLDALTRRLIGGNMMVLLGQSNFVLTDYVLGLLVAVHFIGAVMIGRHVSSTPEWLARPIRYSAEFTFSLYLFHMPLLFAYASIFDHDPNNAGDQALLYTATLLTVWLLGNVTERRKGTTRFVIDKIWDLTLALWRRLRSS